MPMLQKLGHRNTGETYKNEETTGKQWTRSIVSTSAIFSRGCAMTPQKHYLHVDTGLDKIQYFKCFRDLIWVPIIEIWVSNGKECQVHSMHTTFQKIIGSNNHKDFFFSYRHRNMFTWQWLYHGKILFSVLVLRWVNINLLIKRYLLM